MLGECFDEVHHPSEPFVRSLTGEEILTALCEKKCNVSQQYKHYGKNPKTFCSRVFVLKLQKGYAKILSNHSINYFRIQCK